MKRGRQRDKQRDREGGKIIKINKVVEGIEKGLVQ